MSFNRYNFLNENWTTQPASEFSQFNSEDNLTFGAGYGFAVDRSISMDNTNDGAYSPANKIGRLASIINKMNINPFAQLNKGIDYFQEDIDEISDIIILKTVINKSNDIDVFISFKLEEDEYYGVFKNFNKDKIDFKCELFTDVERGYADMSYRLKFSNLFFKIISNWYNIKKSEYTALTDIILYDYILSPITVKKGQKLKVIDCDIPKKEIIVLYKDNRYTLRGNDCYYFKYRTMNI